MLHSTHYNLNLAEGTDLVNPLTVDVPNYQAIDNAMFANEQAGVGTATELKSGTIHAITRANTNRNVFIFKSTSVFLTGDTFTVDGSTVTALYPDGSSLKDRCFIVGSEVLCILDGSLLTVLASYYPEAKDVSFDDVNVSYTATNTQSAIEHASTADGTEYTSGTSVKTKLDNLTDLLAIEEIGHNYTIGANDVHHWNPREDANFGMSGYTPIGVINFFTLASGIVPMSVTINDNSYGMFLRNLTGASISSSFYYTVLYKKTVV